MVLHGRGVGRSDGFARFFARGNFQLRRVWRLVEVDSSGLFSVHYTLFRNSGVLAVLAGLSSYFTARGREPPPRDITTGEAP